MTSWARRALEALLERVHATAEQVGDRFPLYADTTSGVWTTTRRGSWTGGFWAGWLGLRAAATGVADHREQARAVWRRLLQWQEQDTSCRGLIFWYGHLAPESADREQDLFSAARALADAFDPVLGVVPWGSAFGGVREMARVDGVAGVVPLLGWAARQDNGAMLLRSVAERHLRRHLDLCFVDGRVRPALLVAEGGRWQPQSPPGPGWSRGVAWLLLACVDGVQWLGVEFVEPARELAQVWQARYGTGVPLADADQPDGPVDSSAAAIASVALLKLGALTSDETWWQAGTSLLRRTLDDCLIREGPARGAVARGCYELASGAATQHELVWGDFFCALALAIVIGLVPATAI